MKFKFETSKNTVPKEESRETQGNEAEQIIQSLKSFSGSEFLDRLRQLKKGNPGLEDSLLGYKGSDKNFHQDVLSALTFLKREDPTSDTPKYLRDAAYNKSSEYIYYPENQKASRRQYRRIMWGMGGTIAGAAASLGVIAYKENQKVKEAKLIEKHWEAEKLPLSISEIKQQADTIFQKLRNNMMLFHAKDTLEKTIDTHFEKEYSNLEKQSRDEIVDYLDSLHEKAPEVFQKLVLEYWKSNNKLPSNYSDIALASETVSTSIHDFKKKFHTNQTILQKEQEALHSQIQKAYEAAGGGKIIPYTEPKQKEDGLDTTTTKEERDTTQNLEFIKFKAHIDSLTAEEYNQYSAAVNSPLSHEVTTLQDLLGKATEKLQEKEKQANEKILQEQEKDIQALINNEAVDANTFIDTDSKIFTRELWAYLEDYYLVHEVFSDYDGIKDPASEKELAVLGNNPLVASTLNSLINHHAQAFKNLRGEIEQLKIKYNHDRKSTLRQIELDEESTIGPIKDELESKSTQYKKEVDAAYQKYHHEYVKIWNEELKNSNVDIPVKSLED